MAYAAQSDIENRLTAAKLVDLTDFEEAGQVNDARVSAALDAASGMIDAYAPARYDLPLVASAQLNDLCVDLTIFKLYVGRQRAIPATVQTAYENAVAFLKDVSASKASFTQAAAPQVAGSAPQERDHCQDPETFDVNKFDAF